MLFTAIKATRDRQTNHTANWCYNKGFYVEGVGSSHSLIPEGARAFGLNAEGVSKDNYQKVLNALSDGDKSVGVTVDPGTFTNYGHFFILTGMTANGKITIADPGSRKFTGPDRDFSTIHKDVRAMPEEDVLIGLYPSKS